MRKAWVWGGTGIGVVLVLVLMVGFHSLSRLSLDPFSLASGDPRLPSDDEMRKVFAKHRAVFVELGEMALADHAGRVSEDCVEVRVAGSDKWVTARFSKDAGAEELAKALAPTGISVGRYQKYRALLDVVWGSEVGCDYREKVVSVTLGAYGFVASGTQKSIDHALEGGAIQGGTVKDTDGPGTMKKGRYYVEIEPGWYIHAYRW